MAEADEATDDPGRRARPRRWAARAALLIASLGLVGFAAELTLRLLGYEAIYDVYSKPSVLWRHDPLLGWHHEPGARARYKGPRPWPVEFDNEVRINRLGLRGPEPTPLPEGGKRVLFLGDSVVAGFEVAEEETFVAQAAEPLTARLGVPVQTLNAGVRGYGTDQTYLWFRERGRALAADWVVFIHSANDVRNNMTLHRMRRPFGKPAFRLGGDGSLDLVGTPVPDYPFCSHVVLGPGFSPQRLDGWLRRAYCWVEVNLSDRSALFTWATFRVRENSWLLHRIWYFAVPEQELASAPASGLVDGLGSLAGWLGPRAAHAEPVAEESGGSPEAHALTSALLVALAREVRESGAALLMIISESELARVDRAALRSEGARIRSLVIPESMTLGRPTHFLHDGHFNVLGHHLASRVVSEAIAEELAGLPPLPKAPAPTRFRGRRRR